MDRTKLDEVIVRYKQEKGELITILHDIQRAEGYIADEAMLHLSGRLKLPLSEVFRAVSYFGHAFSMQPRAAKHAVRVCQGTACHVRRGAEVMSELKETIEKEGAEAACHLEGVPCLGCCTAAPAVEIDGKLLDKEKAKVVGLMIDKGLLVQTMVDEARANGVEVFTDTNINNVSKEADCVVVTDNRGNEYRGTFVIAADGVNSRIARKLGFNKERIFLGTYRDYARVYEGANVPEEDTLMFCMGWNCSISLAPEIVPGHFHVAAASYNVYQDLDSEIDRFMASEPFAGWFKNAKEVGHRASCVSNIASPLQVPFKDNVLLVGDSGWMQETSIPGAIMPGWLAANAVTEALIRGMINQEGVATFLNWWDKYFYQAHGKRMASSGGAEIKDFLSQDDINYLAKLVPETQPGSMNFFVIMRTIGRAFSAVLPHISEERPDIMQRMMALRSVPKSVALAARCNHGCAIIN